MLQPTVVVSYYGSVGTLILKLCCVYFGPLPSVREVDNADDDEKIN